MKKPKPKLTAIERGEFPGEPKLAAAMRAKFAEGTPVEVSGEIALGVKPKSLGQETVLFIGAKPVKLPAGFYVALGVAEERCAVIERQKGHVFEIDRATLKAKKVCSLPAIVPSGAAWLEDRLAVLEDGGLHLLERDGTILQKVDVDGITIASVGSRLVIGGSKKVQVLDLEDGELALTAKLTAKAPIAIAHEGEFFLTDHRFADRRTAWWKLEG